MIREMFNPYADPNTPDCTCADWGMMTCLTTCLREIYCQQKQVELDRKNNWTGYAHGKNYVDSSGTGSRGEVVEGTDEGRPFIVSEGLGGTGSDGASAGASPADSKQLDGKDHHQPSEFAFEGFAGVARTLYGRGPNPQNIERLPVERLIIDYRKDSGRAFAEYYGDSKIGTSYSRTLLPLSSEDLVKSSSKVTETIIERRLRIALNRAVVNAYYRLFATLGTHRRKAFVDFIRETGSPFLIALFDALGTEPGGYIGERPVWFSPKSVCFDSFINWDTVSFRNDSTTSGAGGAFKTAETLESDSRTVGEASGGVSGPFISEGKESK